MLCTELVENAQASLHMFDNRHHRASMLCDDRWENGPFTRRSIVATAHEQGYKQLVARAVAAVAAVAAEGRRGGLTNGDAAAYPTSSRTTLKQDFFYCYYLIFNHYLLLRLKS
jgi:hypothetical protein